MVEFLKHTLGLCGEHSHPSLLTFITAEGLLNTTFVYLSGIVKNFLKLF
jgi:hypothetical protein